MQTYAGKSKEGVKVINLIPTELGEPLIQAMSGYIDGHVKAYGGYHIPKEYLRHTKVYMSNVLTE